MHALRLFLLCGGGGFAFVLTVGLLLIPLRRVAALARTPGLDGVIALLTWGPWVPAAVVGGWAGFAGCLVGQVIAMYAWCLGHELLHRDAAAGPRIIKFINRRIGRLRNHVGLWATVVAFPIFVLIRLVEMTLWPVLSRIMGFPRYDQAEWVNVSRQKFGGLVGHDLIWCLYCDWMTGVYSLGAEMLRNVESFWCPIRFYEGKKCDNCKLDFPDLDHGWVPADGTMADVDRVMHDKYSDGNHAWFGHPTRLTVNGRETGVVEDKG